MKPGDLVRAPTLTHEPHSRRDPYEWEGAIGVITDIDRSSNYEYIQVMIDSVLFKFHPSTLKPL